MSDPYDGVMVDMEGRRPGSLNGFHAQVAKVVNILGGRSDGEVQRYRSR